MTSILATSLARIAFNTVILFFTFGNFPLKISFQLALLLVGNRHKGYMQEAFYIFHGSLRDPVAGELATFRGVCEQGYPDITTGPIPSTERSRNICLRKVFGRIYDLRHFIRDDFKDAFQGINHVFQTFCLSFENLSGTAGNIVIIFF